jgi:hypothetical protein
LIFQTCACRAILRLHPKAGIWNLESPNTDPR